MSLSTSSLSLSLSSPLLFRFSLQSNKCILSIQCKFTVNLFTAYCHASDYCREHFRRLNTNKESTALHEQASTRILVSNFECFSFYLFKIKIPEQTNNLSSSSGSFNLQDLSEMLSLGQLRTTLITFATTHASTHLE